MYSLLPNIQTDHLIPESISIDRLAQIREERNLPDDFDVNGLENFVLACSQCNRRKSNDDYSEVLQFDILLRAAKKRKSDVERVVRRFRSNRNIVESVELISRVDLGEESNRELLAPFIESVAEDLYSWGVELSPRLYRSLDANNIAGKYAVWCDVGVWLEGKGLVFLTLWSKFEVIQSKTTLSLQLRKFLNILMVKQPKLLSMRCLRMSTSCQAMSMLTFQVSPCR